MDQMRFNAERRKVIRDEIYQFQIGHPAGGIEGYQLLDHLDRVVLLSSHAGDSNIRVRSAIVASPSILFKNALCASIFTAAERCIDISDTPYSVGRSSLEITEMLMFWRAVGKF